MAYLPQVYKGFKKHFPKIASSYDKLAIECNEGGPLEEKERELVRLGIAIGLSAEGSVRSHTRRALDAGVSPEGVRHAVLLALTTAGFPTTIAAMKWVDEVLDKQ
jgi:4-carboxymuconolactone decarboxylase